MIRPRISGLMKLHATRPSVPLLCIALYISLQNSAAKRRNEDSVDRKTTKRTHITYWQRHNDRVEDAEVSAQSWRHSTKSNRGERLKNQTNKICPRIIFKVHEGAISSMEA